MTAGISPQERTAVVAAAYSEEFLSELGTKFNFDALDPRVAREILDIGWRYFADIAIFSDDGSREERRTEYKVLKKQIANFSDLLARPEYADIASDLYFAALRFGAPAPQTEFPQLSEFELTRGAPYLAEFQRLLNLLNDARIMELNAFRHNPDANEITPSRISRGAPPISGRTCSGVPTNLIITPGL